MKLYELRKDLEDKYGLFLKSKEVAKVLRIDEHNVRKAMTGRKYTPMGHMLLWSARDVAEVVVERSVMV